MRRPAPDCRPVIYVPFIRQQAQRERHLLQALQACTAAFTNSMACITMREL